MDKKRGADVKNSILVNYIYNISYQILLMILPLITTPYISRVLGADAIGAYSYTQSITYYFTLIGCFGLNLYGQREVAYVQNDQNKRSQVFWEIVCIRFITHLVSLIAFCVTFVHHKKYAVLFTIQIIDIVASFIDVSWFFQGMEDFKRIVMRNIVIKLAAVVAIFVFVKKPKDIIIYAFIYSLSLLVGNLIMILYLPKLIIKHKIRGVDALKHIKPCLVLFLPQIASSIYNVLDKTMIGALTGIEAEVAFYEQAQKIVKVALSFLTSVGTVMLPRIAVVFARKDYVAIKRYLEKSFRFVFFLGIPLSLGMISTARFLVPWFYGDGFEKVAPNIMVIAPVILIVGLSNVIGVQYLLPTGKQNDYFISVLCGSMMNIVLNIVLIPRLLSLGAAIASIIAELFVLTAQIFMTRKDFDFKYIFKDSIKYFLSGILMAGCIFFETGFLTSSIKSSIIQILTGVIVYFLMLVLMKDALIREILRKIMRKI
ncbi:flippase [Clostridium sp.]